MAVHKGAWCAQLDATSFYDAFLLHPDIARRQCFKKGRRFFCQRTAPMGQRQMCEVGHCTTQALLDDPESNTFNLACIDNTISYGESREQLVETMKRVVRRFKDGNVLLNGQDADGGMDVEALAVQRAEWCGVRFDLVSKEVQLTEKHVGKLGLSLSMRESWSRRSVYAHFGLLPEKASSKHNVNRLPPSSLANTNG